MYLFRKSSEKVLVNNQEPAAQFPENPVTRDAINNLIELEALMAQNKCEDQDFTTLMGIYSVFEA